MNNSEIKKTGNRREFFFDDFCTAECHGLVRRFPVPVANPPEPAQPRGYYMTMLQDNGMIHCYYRGNFNDYTGHHPEFTVKPGFLGEYTAYARSFQGIKFLKPPLFLYDCGVPNVLYAMEKGVHNFCPFYDENPACPPEQRYKAIAGVSDLGGLYGFAGSDPVGFKRIQETPVIPADPAWGYCMDSQNVTFWSELEGCYVCYFRINKGADGQEMRTVAKVTSPDFIHWSKPEIPTLNYPGENLYVSLLAPYYRAKHIYIGTPTRYFEDRGSATDISLIFSRDGKNFIRPLGNAAWIKPGPQPEAWQNRYNYLAYNPVQTGTAEMSYYHIQSGVRYSMRLDGYACLSAGGDTGEWISKRIEYDSGELEFYVATGAGGSFRVELQNADGTPIPGFRLENSRNFYGDSVAYIAEWENGTSCRNDLKKGQPLRIRCVMQDCDLYSFKFNESINQKGK
ncbi:MAG: hypothetical protein IKB16_01165 [Lentisphaeria bacterium]|nr:hypothetical protein [Lentisphaeria bacterium]